MEICEQVKLHTSHEILSSTNAFSGVFNHLHNHRVSPHMPTRVISSGLLLPKESQKCWGFFYACCARGNYIEMCLNGTSSMELYIQFELVGEIVLMDSLLGEKYNMCEMVKKGDDKKDLHAVT